MERREAIPGFDAGMAALETRMTGLAAEQANILAALHLMLDMLDSQNRLLQELAGLAKDEPDSSPLLRSLEGMRRALRDLDGSLQGVAARLETLPQEITTELARQDTANDAGGNALRANPGDGARGP